MAIRYPAFDGIPDEQLCRCFEKGNTNKNRNGGPMSERLKITSLKYDSICKRTDAMTRFGRRERMLVNKRPKENCKATHWKWNDGRRPSSPLWI